MATSNTQSGFVDNWQRGKSVTECNLHMLETEDFTDVTFLVGSEKHVVRAHRFVLASRSCVFHAMFCGRMAEQREITIPDIEVNDFRDFLRFLYSDNITINLKNVTGLMYSSRKYDVETLLKQSTSFLEKSLSEENLCDILEKSHGYGETDLEEKALEMLRSSSSKVTKSSAFLELCSGCFGTFLKSENLNLTEGEVFEAAFSWTKDECEREGLSPSHENMRKILGEMVYEIRFASFSLEFLTNIVGPSEMLTEKERVKIMDQKINRQTDISPFRSHVRKTEWPNQPSHHDIYYANRFQTMKMKAFKGGPHVVSFSTNKKITLLGCRLFGTGVVFYPRLVIKVFDNERNRISYPVQNIRWSLSNFINDIIFPDPIIIQAGREYRIFVKVSKDFCAVGYKGSQRISVGGVEFVFSDIQDELSHTTVEIGQIPGLIWQ